MLWFENAVETRIFQAEIAAHFANSLMAACSMYRHLIERIMNGASLCPSTTSVLMCAENEFLLRAVKTKIGVLSQCFARVSSIKRRHPGSASVRVPPRGMCDASVAL